LPAHAPDDVLRYLNEVPEGLDRALEHQVLASLTDLETERLIEALRRSSGPWQYRAVSLHV
jgi:hypothetical protein